MMNLLKHIFHPNVFPKECNDGKIEIVGNKIIYVGDHGIYSTEINIDDIQYVYVIVNSNNQSFLFLFDHHQHWLPTSYPGFGETYKNISKRYNFSDRTFFNCVHQNTILKKEIWRKIYTPTYKVKSTIQKDYGSGFEILSPKKIFISWNTTYEQLTLVEHCYIDKSIYGSKILKFKYPVRVGNVEIYNMFTYLDNYRKDVPVLSFQAECFDSVGSDTSYNELKKVFLNDIDLRKSENNYERDDQKRLIFNSNEIDFTIDYTYDSQYQFNAGYTLLTVKNNRIYPNYLLNTYYEKIITISNFLIIDGSIQISADYRKNEKIKKRPEYITKKFHNQNIIWIDDVNEKIGFSCGDFSQVYNKAEVVSLNIQNISPAKGSGGSYLQLNLKDQNFSYTIFSGQYSFFNKYTNELVNIIKKPLNILPEYPDC